MKNAVVLCFVVLGCAGAAMAQTPYYYTTLNPWGSNVIGCPLGIANINGGPGGGRLLPRLRQRQLRYRRAGQFERQRNGDQSAPADSRRHPRQPVGFRPGVRGQRCGQRHRRQRRHRGLSRGRRRLQRLLPPRGWRHGNRPALPGPELEVGYRHGRQQYRARRRLLDCDRRQQSCVRLVRQRRDDRSGRQRRQQCGLRHQPQRQRDRGHHWFFSYRL